MDSNEAGVIGMVLVMAPVIMWVYYRIERDKATRGGMNPVQQQQMWETAQRMERRMESLEQLLDSEVPGWRSRSNLK